MKTLLLSAALLLPAGADDITVRVQCGELNGKRMCMIEESAYDELVDNSNKAHASLKVLLRHCAKQEKI